MADLNVTNQQAPKIDLAKWKKLTPQEIIKEEGKGEEVPAEVLAWAQQMAAYAKIPDNVTYDKVDGDTGLDALEKLGLPTEDVQTQDKTNAQKPTDTATPDAVKDTTKPEILQPENQDNIFATENPTATAAATTQNTVPTTDTLADTKLTTDPEEIRKRKLKRGEIA